jgi:uncharacterized membrane protein
MRVPVLDALRGLAVIWMVIFHTAYDLKLLGFVNWDFSQGFWFGFPRVIAFTFLFCVGWSLNYSQRPHIKWRELKNRTLKLGSAALLISLSTYFIFPHEWIYFGTLHCILVGSLLGSLLVNHRVMAWLVLALILMAQYGLGYDIKWVSSILQKPSMDFIPIYPWFWAILAGMLFGPVVSKIRQIQNTPPPLLLKWPGNHSLKIYLLHQPIIFGFLWALRALV